MVVPKICSGAARASGRGPPAFAGRPAAGSATERKHGLSRNSKSRAPRKFRPRNSSPLEPGAAFSCRLPPPTGGTSNPGSRVGVHPAGPPSDPRPFHPTLPRRFRLQRSPRAMGYHGNGQGAGRTEQIVPARPLPGGRGGMRPRLEQVGKRERKTNHSARMRPGRFGGSVGSPRSDRKRSGPMLGSSRAWRCSGRRKLSCPGCQIRRESRRGNTSKSAWRSGVQRGKACCSRPTGRSPNQRWRRPAGPKRNPRRKGLCLCSLSIKQQRLLRYQKKEGYQDIFDYSFLNIFDHPFYKESNLLHLHNLHDDYFSLFLLPRMSKEKKVVWTLHDAHSMSGHCAHSLNCKKWMESCGACPALNIFAGKER